MIVYLFTTNYIENGDSPIGSDMYYTCTLVFYDQNLIRPTPSSRTCTFTNEL